MQTNSFIQAINEFCVACHANAKAKGFYDLPDAAEILVDIVEREQGLTVGETLKLKASIREAYSRKKSDEIALMHSELSEHLEAARHGNGPSEHIPEFTAEEEELADLLIRAGDMAGRHGYRLAEAIVAKMAFNATRPHKHGKKF